MMIIRYNYSTTELPNFKLEANLRKYCFFQRQTKNALRCTFCI